MSFLYSIFGLRVQSNQPLPALVSCPGSPTLDVDIRLGVRPAWADSSAQADAQPWYVSHMDDVDGQPALTVWKLRADAGYQFRYSDGTEFLVDRLGTRVWGTWPSCLTLEDTATYLLGPILGFLLRLRGTICLHASAVARDDQAIALVGPAGAGKSTTAAALACLGHPVLTDDVLVLSESAGTFWVQPGSPWIRLWPESVTGLFGSHESLPRLTPNWEKRYLDVSQASYRFQAQPLPLGAIYLLGERSAGDSRLHIEGVSFRTGLMSLVGDTYTNYLLDRTQRAQEFNLLGRLVASVPVRQVRAQNHLSGLASLCETILDDFQQLCCRRAGKKVAG